ncbi:MAG: histidine phosphatase family protein [Paracoccaceae bacterium]
MLRLLLMRHAKSDWNTPETGDHERGLNPRGRASATALGDWLRDHNYTPNTVISSTATRTAQTLERLQINASVQFTQRLYHASPSDMFDVLNGAQGSCVLILGHNPGIASFANALLAKTPNHARFSDYPTCATLVADFQINDWSELQWQTGTPINFVVPRDIIEP